jgi:hypothetical protein
MVGPDVFKVLYLEKHTKILCYYVLTKLVNGPLYSNTDRVRALEERLSCCRRNMAARQLSLLQHATMYNRITSTKSPSVFMATSTNFMALIPHSRDCSYYESRRILALPPLRPAETHCSTCTQLCALVGLVTSSYPRKHYMCL